MKNIFYLLSFALLFQSCDATSPIKVEYNPYIQAFTSDRVSIQSGMQVVFAEEIDSNLDQAALLKLVTISPKVSGEISVIDRNILSFTPKGMLKPDKIYEVSLDVEKIIGKPIEKEYKTFKFSVQTIRPNFSVESSGLILTGENKSPNYQLTILIQTDDYANDSDVEKMISLSGYKLKWEHTNNRVHNCVIDGIKAGEKSFDLNIVCDGSPIDVDKKTKIDIRVPSKYEFSLLGIDVVSDPQQIVCRFSSAINAKQNLSSYFTIGSNKLTFKVVNNQVYIYPTTKITGSNILVIHEGLKSSIGGELTGNHEHEFQFESYNPEVRFTGQGTILPTSKGLILPFQAVSLKAVQVRIIKIYENNMMQFLQVNKLNGDKELKRAGKIIVIKTIKLDENNSIKELKQWNTFSLDLAKIINPEPGAVYRVELSFTKANAIHDCEETSDEETLSDEEQLAQEKEQYNNFEITYYDDYYSGYYDDDSNDFNSDPCSNSYYSNKTVSKNVLASDIGFIAKLDQENTIHAILTKISDLSSLAGVTVEAYDYQQQLIGSGVSNNDGFASFPIKGKVFILVAKHKQERAYLQMNDGLSLSLSRFDVGGSKVEQGTKGFIYTERGVWRPGDTIFVGFILQNKSKDSPTNHPVNLEIRNARGQVVNKQIATKGTNGFYTFKYASDSDAPTGNWTATVKIGGAEFNKQLKVETIKPNRLKITLEFDNKLIRLDEIIEGKLTAKWLHGSPASGLKTNVTMQLTPIKTTFKSFSNYEFDHPIKIFPKQETNILTDHLNNRGEVSFSKRIPPIVSASGFLSAQFVSEVMEDGGDISIDHYTTIVSPYASYVGVLAPKGTGYGNMLETDKRQQYEIVTVDNDGNALNRSINVKIYKLGWSWWWSSSNNQLANYSQSEYSTPILSQNITTVKGKATFSYTAKRYGFYLLVFEDQISGHSSAVTSYYDSPNWGGRARQEGNEGANLLSFSADKEKYKVGDEAIIKVPTAPGSRILVSIENGSTVLQNYWKDATGTQTELKLPITAQMAPNVYLSLTLVQPHDQSQNDSPIRLYGVIPLLVEDPNTILAPVLELPEVIRPQEEYTIKVSEKSNQGMTYTLAVVDEGLLDLTRFQTPNPGSYFFAREALGVKTWDMYDAVLGAYGGKIQQMFAIGGDNELSKNQTKVTRFKPVVTFLGPFVLNQGKTNSHKIMTSNYIGSVRVMVVAANDRAYGSVAESVPVRSPLMVLATLPRVLGPGEEVNLPINVFALESDIKTVNLTLEVNELLQADKTSQTLRFNAPSDQLTHFRLKVNNLIGKAKIKVIAKSGSKSSIHEIELEVRNPNPSLTKLDQHLLADGKEWNTTVNLVGVDGSNSATLEASHLPPINLTSRLGYLLAYPHGCLEQTTSAAFPQLYLPELVTLTSEEIERSSTNVKAAIERLAKFVAPDGGFSYWPGGRSANLWATSYAGDFMLEAKAKGYIVPSNLLDKWIQFQQKEARNWKAKITTNNSDSDSQTDLDQAYRLYTLAKAKSSEMGPMNRLKDYTSLSLQARWVLAAAYALSNQQTVALGLIEKSNTKMPAYKSSFSESYGSIDRDKALVVDALVKMKKMEMAFGLVKEISTALNSDSWMSTQTTAYCLMAVARYANQVGTNKGVELEYVFDGKTQRVNVEKSFWKVDLGKMKSASSLKVKNKAGHNLFIQLATTGIPPAGEEQESENGLKIKVNYFTRSLTSLDVSKLSQGTDFIAQVRVENHSFSKQSYKNLVLSQIFPSGWEITNDRLMGIESSVEYDYCDIRDDRVYSYFGLATGESLTFTVKLTAAYKGRFYLPATKVEAMYDGSINANSIGKWIVVE